MKRQLIGIMSRCTIRKHSELISETQCTSDCQRLYKKCHLLWKPFGGKNQKAYSQQYHYWLTDDVTISSLPVVVGIVFIKQKTANNKYVVSFYKQHIFVILIIFTFLWFENAWILQLENQHRHSGSCYMWRSENASLMTIALIHNWFQFYLNL